MNEIEKRLREHSKNVKSFMSTPFDIEREELYMTKRKFNFKWVILAAAIICFIGTTVFATVKFLSPKEIAGELGDKTLAEYFGEGAVSETKTDGKYKATVLGVTSGEKISDFKASAWEVYPDRTYVAVAVEKTDGSEMTYDDEILVTPFISGLDPQRYNIITMHGGYSAKIIDGILYRIIECDSIEYFADGNLYIGIADTVFPKKGQFDFDEDTGNISENKEYSGTNILFELKLDKSKANPEKAQEYLKSLENQSGEADEEADTDEETDEFIINEDFEIIPVE